MMIGGKNIYARAEIWRDRERLFLFYTYTHGGIGTYSASALQLIYTSRETCRFYFDRTGGFIKRCGDCPTGVIKCTEIKGKVCVYAHVCVRELWRGL